jgi:Ca-activated chloride channel family protein
MKQGSLKLLISIAVLLCCACSQVRGKLLIMEGSFFNSQGMYTEAITAYLEALDYPEAALYAQYALGAVYMTLDEGEAALERFAAAEEALTKALGEHPELRFRLHYNTGVVRFHRGDFSLAAEEFKSALRIDGSRVEAKRNLELSLLATAGQGATYGATPIQTVSGAQGTGALFDYLRQKEQDRWKSRTWTGESSQSGPDY